MNRSKLVSVRLDPDDVKVIDEWVEGIYYRKRSDIINAGVRLMVQLIKRGQAEKAVQFWPAHDVIDTLEFKYHREFKK